MQKNKFKISVLKLLFWNPKKALFWFLKKNKTKNVFSVFWLWFGFKNNRHTNVLLVGIYEQALKKLLAVKNAILAIFGGY